jgi:hypothetical protein
VVKEPENTIAARGAASHSLNRMSMHGQSLNRTSPSSRFSENLLAIAGTYAVRQNVAMGV